MPLAPTSLQRLASTQLGRRFSGALADAADARLVGVENVPLAGGALLVGNHALLGLDAFPLTALIIVHTGRAPRFLGERNLWRMPGLRRVLDAVGAIPGTPDDAVRLLAEGELVCVYPGGIDDSFKPSREAYTLKWGERAGFARVAIRAGVPIVPIAATGVDEIFEVKRHEHFLGRRFGGAPRYDIPLPENLWPRRVPLEYHALAAIDTRGDVEDPSVVERVRLATRGAIEGVLTRYREGLAR
jgi:1-acyl-sn-glycerol-3-phosphate acyltransferase